MPATVAAALRRATFTAGNRAGVICPAPCGQILYTPRCPAASRHAEAARVMSAHWAGGCPLVAELAATP